MSCINFTQAKNIFKCTESIIVGKISLMNQKVFVYIQRLNSNYVSRFTVTSDEEGVITVPIENVNYLSPNFRYKLWVSPLEATTSDDFLPVTVGEEEYEGFIFGVERVNGQESEIKIDCAC